jgi:hypothetical protein
MVHWAKKSSDRRFAVWFSRMFEEKTDPGRVSRTETHGFDNVNVIGSMVGFQLALLIFSSTISSP